MEKKKGISFNWLLIFMVFLSLYIVATPLLYVFGMLSYFIGYEIGESTWLVSWVVSYLLLIVLVILCKRKKKEKLFKYGVLSLIIAILSFMIAPGFTKAKPVIYLYPEKIQNVKIDIEYKGKLLCTYPSIGENGWEVIVYPDGTIEDIETGRKYYCLFWEGRDKLKIDIDSGFIVPGEHTAEFLEGKLQEIGLNEIEANEFIIYWLPKMIDNKYNLIHFATDEYNKLVPLKVDPKPDTVIRVLMLYKAVNRPFDITPQTFEPKERNGFTLVEWGGTEM